MCYERALCRYGKLAWKWHPLKNLAFPSEAETMFTKVAEAYEILSDGTRSSEE